MIPADRLAFGLALVLEPIPMSQQYRMRLIPADLTLPTLPIDPALALVLALALDFVQREGVEGWYCSCY